MLQVIRRPDQVQWRSRLYAECDVLGIDRKLMNKRLVKRLKELPQPVHFAS